MYIVVVPQHLIHHLQNRIAQQQPRVVSLTASLFCWTQLQVVSGVEIYIKKKQLSLVRNHCFQRGHPEWPPLFPLKDPSSVNCQTSCSLGPFIEDVGKFNAILTPPFYRRQFFTAIPFKMSACLWGVGVFSYADGQKVTVLTVHKDQKFPS